MLVDQLVGRTPSDPASAFRQHMSFRETTRYWGDRAARDRVEGDPPGWELRGYRFIKSEFFKQPLSADVILALLENFRKDRVAGQSRELDFSPWGGGYNRLSADATAFVHRDDLFGSNTPPRSTRAGRLRGSPRLGHSVVGDGPSVGDGARISELPRSGSGRLGKRLLRLEPGPLGERKGQVRSGESLALSPVAPHARTGAGGDGSRSWPAVHTWRTFEHKPAEERHRRRDEAMADDESHIRALIESWARAVHQGDMDGVLADHADDIVMFDVPPPSDGVRGIVAYRETWPPFFTWQEQGASFEIVSLDVTAGADVAFAYALPRGGATKRPSNCWWSGIAGSSTPTATGCSARSRTRRTPSRSPCSERGGAWPASMAGARCGPGSTRWRPTPACGSPRCDPEGCCRLTTARPAPTPAISGSR